MKYSLIVIAALCLAAPLYAASIATGVSGDFTIETISTSDIGQIGQLTFGPDGRLYVATRFDGIKSFSYDPNGLLSDEKQASTRNSLGIAFHDDPVLGSVMYLSGAICFAPSTPPPPADQDIYRLTDDDDDGVWGEAGEVDQRIARIWMSCYHQINQVQVLDDSLYLSAGSRSNLGDYETQYTGAIIWIKDLKLLNGDTTTTDIADFTIADNDTAKYQDTQAITSTASDKLIVHSKGLRNNYGIAFDAGDRIWVSMNQTETANTPHDELWIGFEFADYDYPSSNPEISNWRTNADALAAGFFQTLGTPVTPRGTAPGGLGAHVAAGGLDFTYSSSFSPVYHGDAFLARWSRSDVVACDETIGSVTQIATGFNNCLDVQADPFGNLLVADGGGGGTRSIHRIKGTLVPGPPIITQQPTDTGTTSGGTVIFRVSAIDPESGTPAYQWFYDPNIGTGGDETALLDSGDISGVTTDTLTITNVDARRVGHYFCRVTNAIDSVDTVKAALVLGSATHVDTDITTQSNWRTAAALESDDEYGTDGYVIYGLNQDDGIWNGSYDASSANPDNVYNLPLYIADVTLTDATGMWSGNGNFGQIEDPNGSNALTNTPLLANGAPDPWTFTITRNQNVGFRLTVILSNGDSASSEWNTTVDNLVSPITSNFTVPDTSSTSYYEVFDIPSGSGPVDVIVEYVTSGSRFNVTGFAFDPLLIPPPTVIQQPADQYIFPGDPASFAVMASSGSAGPFYQWYKSDPETLLVGQTGPNLTINSSMVPDIGGYFCRISNDGGSVDSAIAQLDIKRCLYHWPLDGDAVEANGTGYDGTEIGDAAYVTNSEFPWLGQTLSLDGTGDWIELGNVPLSSTGAISISAWAKSSNVSANWRGIVSKWTADQSRRSFWFGQHGIDGWLRFGVYVTPGSPTLESPVDSDQVVLTNDLWTHFVCTYDGSQSRIYANGVLVATGSDLNLPFLDRDGVLYIGAVIQNNGGFPGMVDDVRIYNYAISDLEAFTLYDDVVGGFICPVILPGDLNGDCVVDLTDLLILAERFLSVSS